MASRRLDISSLLCNDDSIEPAVHPSHLTYSTQSSTPAHTRHASPPSTSTLFSQQPQIVQSQSNRPSSSQSHSSRHPRSPTPNQYPLSTPPVLNSHQHPSPSSAITPKLSSFGLDALAQAATEERRRLSGGGSTVLDIPKRTSPSVEQRQIAQSQPYHHLQNPRQLKSSDDHIRSPIVSAAHTVHSPNQPIDSPVQPVVYSPILQQRHRTTEKRRTPLDESQARRSPADDMPYRLPPPYFSPPFQSQPSRQLLEHEHRLQRQRELQRQRQHHEQLLLQEQHQQQLSLQHQILYSEKKSIPTTSSWGPPIPFHDATFQSPSRPSITSPQTAGRKSDPGQPHRVVTPAQAGPFPPGFISQSSATESIQASALPSKRRRYSDSPINLVTSQDKERLNRERERMPMVAESSTRPSADGRGLSPVQPPNRKHLGLSELIITEPDTGQMHNRGNRSAVELSQDRSLPILYPLNRRSPPGSQVGRAIAARKSEETEQVIPDLVSRVALKTVPVSEGCERHTPFSRRTPAASPVPEPAPIVRKTSPPPVQDDSTTDAHEWFLEHFDDDNAPTAPQPSTFHMSPRSDPTLLPPQRASESPLPDKRTPTPTTMPDAAAALEQELNEMISDSSEHTSKVEPDTADMDVDLAITELVAETLEADRLKLEDVGMEDVEDELLSLVDDRLTTPRSVVKSATPATSVLKSQTVSRANSNVAKHTPPLAMCGGPTSSPCELNSATPFTQSTSELGSAPPLHLQVLAKGVEKEESIIEGVDGVAPALLSKKKKKETTPKPNIKSKATAPSTATASNVKSRSKPSTKPKHKISDAQPKARSSAGLKKLPASRSRSTSVMPVPDSSEAKAEKHEEEEESDNHEDDKLYCVCKTKYDEDRFMIACDRCDEWYHTQCVDMPDLEVDLVDQFICPICIEKNPHLLLRTTYKPRCLYGLRHPDPDSSKACHKPARGVFSKYCSDECGIRYMQSRAEVWAKKGGKKEKLWEAVKDAEKREGIVVRLDDKNNVKVGIDEECNNGKDKVNKLKRAKVEREVEQLNKVLDSIVKLREELKKGMECVEWREKLLELAAERAEQIGECGWDQRLCFGDEEWTDFGADVLESYEDVKAEDVKVEQGESRASESGGEWWCPGKKMCERHAGWQAVRYKDVCKEKEKKRDALSHLTTREREIRKRIEDILDPHGRNCTELPLKSPLKATNGKLPNGHAKGKNNVDTTKKGKKRKAPS